MRFPEINTVWLLGSATLVPPNGATNGTGIVLLANDVSVASTALNSTSPSGARTINVSVDTESALTAANEALSAASLRTLAVCRFLEMPDIVVYSNLLHVNVLFIFFLLKFRQGVQRRKASPSFAGQRLKRRVTCLTQEEQ